MNTPTPAPPCWPFMTPLDRMVYRLAGATQWNIWRGRPADGLSRPSQRLPAIAAAGLCRWFKDRQLCPWSDIDRPVFAPRNHRNTDMAVYCRPTVSVHSHGCKYIGGYLQCVYLTPSNQPDVKSKQMDEVGVAATKGTPVHWCEG